MSKKININTFEGGKCLKFREFIKQLINNSTDIELITINSDEEYEKSKTV